MVKIFIAGDVINCNNVDGKICGPGLESRIKNSDYAICNFEAVIDNIYPPRPKSGPNITQRIETISALKQHGFDLLLLANNHIMDYGYEGLSLTQDAVKNVSLDHIGAGLTLEDAYRTKIIELENLKIGIINACEAQFGALDYSSDEAFGYAWVNHRKINEMVRELSSKCDYVIFCVHAGLENVSVPLTSWRERYKELCDLGVDVVVGSHPHVPQGYEKYKSSYIFYSLGNFFFDYDYAKTAKNHSYSVELKFNKEKEIDFNLIHHKTTGKLVDICSDEVNVILLNKYLSSGESEEYRKMILETYEEIVKPRLLGPPSLLNRISSFKSLPKEILATLIGRRRKKISKLELFHFVRNETYHNVSVSALNIQRKLECVKNND